MSLTLIRDEYKSIMDGIDGIGVVHRYSRLAVDWAKFLEFFRYIDSSGTRILGWDITREKMTVVQPYISGETPNRVADLQYTMLLRGLHGLQDEKATAIVFEELCDAVLKKFLPLDTLNGKALRTEPMTLDLYQERLIGGVLCHYSELRQMVWDRVSY